MASLKLRFSLESDEDVFRIVMVPANASFADLDSILNSSFQWGACYSHRFVVSDRIMDPEEEPYTALADLKGETIVYNYIMDTPCAVRVECMGDSGRDLHGTPVLMKWKGMPPTEGFRGKVSFDRETVRNSLQTWGVQGIRPEGAEGLDTMVRMDILSLLLHPTGDPVVFSRSDGCADFATEGGFDPEDVSSDPDNFTYVLEDPDTYYRDLIVRFSKTRAGRGIRVGGDPYTVMDAIASSQKGSEWINYILEEFTMLVMTWASVNGFYFERQSDDRGSGDGDAYVRPWMDPEYMDVLDARAEDPGFLTELQRETAYVRSWLLTPGAYGNLYANTLGEAENGVRLAILRLGLRSYYGIGTDPDLEEAFRWFSEGERLGNRYCRTMLAELCLWDLPGRKTPEEVFELARNAAGQGCPEAMDLVGSLFAEGLGTQRSPEKAAKWFLKAADTGYWTSNLKLGKLCIMGMWGEPEDALGYYEKAAENGSAEAMFCIGLMFMDGTGVKESVDNALQCLVMSGNYGFRRGYTTAADIMVEELGIPEDDRMVTELRAKADAMAD